MVSVMEIIRLRKSCRTFRQDSPPPEVLADLQKFIDSNLEGPWRVIKERGNPLFHFYLERTPGYDKFTGPVRLQEIDMGIAFCHFHLSAEESGCQGTWIIDAPLIPTGNREYRATWKGKSI